MSMKKLIMHFLVEHGERLAFIMLATIFATCMYKWMPQTREQIVAIYFILLGLLINKARSPKDETTEEK
jgi:hypothetical protein